MFNTQAAHQYSGRGLNATEDAGKDPRVIWTMEEVNEICLLLTLNNHNQLFPSVFFKKINSQLKSFIFVLTILKCENFPYIWKISKTDQPCWAWLLTEMST